MIINLSNFGGGGGSYTLPIASDTRLGGVKVGSGLTINSAGTLSADIQDVSTKQNRYEVSSLEDITNPQEGDIAVVQQLVTYTASNVLGPAMNSNYAPQNVYLYQTNEDENVWIGYATDQMWCDAYVTTNFYYTGDDWYNGYLTDTISLDNWITLSDSTGHGTPLPSTPLYVLMRGWGGFGSSLDGAEVYFCESPSIIGGNKTYQYNNGEWIELGQGGSVMYDDIAEANNQAFFAANTGITHYISEWIGQPIINEDPWLLNEMGELYGLWLNKTDNTITVPWAEGVSVVLYDMGNPQETGSALYFVDYTNDRFIKGYADYDTQGYPVVADYTSVTEKINEGGGSTEINHIIPVTELPASADSMTVYNYKEKLPIFRFYINNVETTSSSYIEINSVITLHYEGDYAALVSMYISGKYIIVSKHGNDYYRYYDSNIKIVNGDVDNGITYSFSQNGDLIMVTSRTFYAGEFKLLAELNSQEKYEEKLVKYTEQETMFADVEYFDNAVSYYEVNYDELPKERVYLCTITGATNALNIYLDHDVITVCSNNNNIITDVVNHNYFLEDRNSFSNDVRYIIRWYGNNITIASSYGNGTSYKVNMNYSGKTSYNWSKIGWIKANTSHSFKNGYWDADSMFVFDSNGRKVMRRKHTITDVNLYINSNNTTHILAGHPENQQPSFIKILTPTTTGTTGYVCVAGNGWSAPTWAAPESLTNGIKFWKGTQDEYDEIGEGNYDSSTLYIIVEDE